jgi:hypothetical protein
MGERLSHPVEAGFKLVRPNQDSSASIQLIAVQVREADMDLFYYRLLKEKLHVQSEDSWFEEWDRRRAAGDTFHCLYHSCIAVRKPETFLLLWFRRPDFKLLVYRNAMRLRPESPFYFSSS